MADVRSRNWLFVFYPDSAPADWADVIDQWGVSCYVSPIHDRDIAKDGMFKKAHWHGVLSFEGNKSYGQVLALCSELGCSTVKVCNSFQNAVRYLCHLDHPQKAQYDLSDVQVFGHADLSALYLKSDSELTRDVLDVVRLIRKMDFREFYELVDYVIDNCSSDYFECVRKNGLFLKAYIVSYAFARRV